MPKKTILLITVVALLSACKAHTTADTLVGDHTDSINYKPRLSNHSKIFNDQSVISEWWNSFNEPELQLLVNDALKNNYSIKAAKLAVTSARALAFEAKLDRLPGVGAFADADFSQISNARSNNNVNNRVNDSYSASFDTVWEADLFGRVAALETRAQENVYLRQAQLRGAYVSVASEVAHNYMLALGSNTQLEIVNQQIETINKRIELQTLLFNQGAASQLEVNQLQANLEQLRASVPQLKATFVLSINRLAVLTGKEPGQIKLKQRVMNQLPIMPPSVGLGDIKSLLVRRPDIAEARADLGIKLADYQVNVADLFPRVEFNGSVGFSATNFSDLGRGSSGVFTFGPSLSWAAFSLPWVKARINAADADTNQSLALYQQSVLTALEEVDNAINQFTLLEKKRNHRVKAREQHIALLELQQERFNAGIQSKLGVLEAKSQMLEVNVQIAQDEEQLLLQLVQLYKSLGGGWDVQIVNNNNE